MTPEQLADALEALADGPPWDTAWLRSLLPELAVRGRLVAQEAGDTAIEEKKERAPGRTLPPGWRWQSIGGISSIRTGKTPSKSRPEYWGGEIPWVSPKDMKSLTIHATEDTVTTAAVSDGLSLAPAGTVLLVVRSGILRHTIPVAVAGVECTTNQDIKQVRLDNPEQSRFLQLLIRGRQSEILSRFVKTGTTVQSLKSKEFFDAQFPFPPLAEQHRIVAKVDELMGHAAVVEERHLAATSARVRFRDAALHALAEAEDHEAVEAAWSRIEDHFDDLFTEPEDIQPLRQTILQLAVRGRLVAQEAGDEAVRPIQDLCKSISTSGHKVKTSQIEKSGPVPVVDQGQGLIAGYTSRRDLAITVDAPMLVFGDHTRAVKFIDFDFVAGADGTKILRPVGVDARYLYVSIQAADLESRGYGRHFKILKATEIRVPPLAEQHRVVAKVDELMALCDTLEASLTRAKTTREQFASSVSHALTGPTAASA